MKPQKREPPGRAKQPAVLGSRGLGFSPNLAPGDAEPWAASFLCTVGTGSRWDSSHPVPAWAVHGPPGTLPAP